MNYYPPELTDWWMDDWISLVYGMSRTFKATDVRVLHHTGEECSERLSSLFSQLLECRIELGLGFVFTSFRVKLEGL